MKNLFILSALFLVLFACSGPEQKLVDAQCKCDQMEDNEKLNCFEDVEKEFSSEAIAEMDAQKLADAMVNSACNKEVEGEFEPMDSEQALKAAEQIIEYHKNALED